MYHPYHIFSIGNTQYFSTENTSITQVRWSSEPFDATDSRYCLELSQLNELIEWSVFAREETNSAIVFTIAKTVENSSLETQCRTCLHLRCTAVVL